MNAALGRLEEELRAQLSDPREALSLRLRFEVTEHPLGECVDVGAIGATLLHADLLPQPP
jgi:hypothetical protein